MKKIAVVLLALGTLSMSGCGSAPQTVEREEEYTVVETTLIETHKILRDGREVVCLNTPHGGLSCDWENAE